MEVAYDEGYQLKKKFNLNWFDETNVVIENQTSQVIKKIFNILIIICRLWEKLMRY